MAWTELFTTSPTTDLDKFAVAMQGMATWYGTFTRATLISYLTRKSKLGFRAFFYESGNAKLALATGVPLPGSMKVYLVGGTNFNQSLGDTMMTQVKVLMAYYGVKATWAEYSPTQSTTLAKAVYGAIPDSLTRNGFTNIVVTHLSADMDRISATIP